MVPCGKRRGIGGLGVNNVIIHRFGLCSLSFYTPVEMVKVEY